MMKAKRTANKTVTKENTALVFGYFYNARQTAPNFCEGEVNSLLDVVYLAIDQFNGDDRPGVFIIPRDGSYVRFIADSWYSDIDVQNL